jgi:polyisoprenoid-binding protein YceI
MNSKPLSLLPLFIFMPLSWIKAIEIAFDFKDPKNVNNIIFQMDAPLESINGSADGISGKVLFDPKNPASTKGKIVLEAKSLHVGNPVLKEHMLGKDWLHVEKFPMITFNLNQLKNTKKDGPHITGQAQGKMNIRNVTLDMEIPVKITFLEGMLEKRNRVKGDLLIIRSKFIVKRNDFNIQADQKLEKVANDIEISLNVAGAAPM